MDIHKIIDDYVDCGERNMCHECEANKHINDSSYTFCMLLSFYRQRLQDKIMEVIEKN